MDTLHCEESCNCATMLGAINAEDNFGKHHGIYWKQVVPNERHFSFSLPKKVGDIINPRGEFSQTDRTLAVIVRPRILACHLVAARLRQWIHKSRWTPAHNSRSDIVERIWIKHSCACLLTLNRSLAVRATTPSVRTCLRALTSETQHQRKQSEPAI